MTINSASGEVRYENDAIDYGMAFNYKDIVAQEYALFVESSTEGEITLLDVFLKNLDF